MKYLVIIPTYNERENIERLVPQTLSISEEIYILIVDDNSPDGTGELADRLSAKDGRVNVIHREKKLGMGKAYIEGFKYAIKAGYNCIIQMDADFSHDPKYIPVFMEKIKEYDLVIGSRYCDGIRIINWSFFRLTLSLFACKYVKFFTRLPFHDCLGGFKCYRRDVLESVGPDKIVSDGYVFQMEILYKAYKKGYRICEIPIVFADRGFGESKMSRKVIFEAFYKVPLIRLKYLFSNSSDR